LRETFSGSLEEEQPKKKRRKARTIGKTSGGAAGL
jgi:hypothetical protein